MQVCFVYSEIYCHYQKVLLPEYYEFWKNSSMHLSLRNLITVIVVIVSLLYGRFDKQISRGSIVSKTVLHEYLNLINGQENWPNDHITSVLCQLHCLLIHTRIIYNILLLTFKIVIGSVPTYLCDFLSLHLEPYTQVETTLAYRSSHGTATTMVLVLFPFALLNHNMISRWKYKALH